MGVTALDKDALDEQQAMFRSAMKANSEQVMTSPYTQNPLTRLWQIFGANQILVQAFPEYFKMAELAMVLVLSSAEDERTFSTVGTVKSKVRNKLTDHLALCVQMKTQHFWTLDTFPFGEAMQEWRLIKARYGLNGL